MIKNFKSKAITLLIFYLLFVIANIFFMFVGKQLNSSGMFGEISDFLVFPIIVCLGYLMLSIKSDRIKFLRFNIVFLIFYIIFFLDFLILKNKDTNSEFVYSINIIISQLHSILIHFASHLNSELTRTILFWLLSFSIVLYLYILGLLARRIKTIIFN